MKALRLILIMALAATIPACNDENFDKEKCTITEFSNVGKMIVEQDSNIYQLYWEAPKIKTNRNNTTVIVTDDCEYEVCVLIVDNSNMDEYSNLEEYFPTIKCIRISKTTGAYARISSDEVIKALGDVKDFYFAVRLPNVHARVSNLDWDSDIFDGLFCTSKEMNVETMPNSQKDNHFNVYSSDESKGTVSRSGYYDYGEDVVLKATGKNGYSFYCWSDGYSNSEYETVIFDDLWAVFRKQNYKLENYYQEPNTWFVYNNATGYVEDGNYIISIEGEVERDDNGNATVWNDNFEIVFNGLPLQSIGNEFKIEFDIMWVGDKEGAVFRICSGADNYIEEISKMDETFVPLSQENEEVWKQEFNTELIFADFNEGMGKTFVVGPVWKHIEWSGTIGERGEKYIGVEINLSGDEDENGRIYNNGPGTFTIRNMQILINGKHVW